MHRYRRLPGGDRMLPTPYSVGRARSRARRSAPTSRPCSRCRQEAGEWLPCALNGRKTFESDADETLRGGMCAHLAPLLASHSPRYRQYLLPTDNAVGHTGTKLAVSRSDAIDYKTKPVH